MGEEALALRPGSGERLLVREDDAVTCIEGLRDAGFDDAAATELAALLEAFPDFRLPPVE